MRYPLKLSPSGTFVEGIVSLPGVSPATDLGRPAGQRPALFDASSVGREADLDVYDGQAWVAIQLDKAARYWEYVQAMVKAGKLALTPYLSQQLARFARKSASGLYTALPLDEWGIGPLRVQGGAYSVAAADAVARMEASGVALKQSVWDALDAAAAAEAKERSYR